MKIKTILARTILPLAFAASASAGFVEVSANISSDTRWTRDNVYILRRVIYVLPPAKLVIEPGTIIRGVKEGSGFDTADPNEPGCLCISRGAKLFAVGTPDDPIIFTSIDDPHVIGGSATIPANVNGAAVTQQNYAPDGPTGTNGFAYDSQWGGLIVLGESPIGYDGINGAGVLSYNPATNSFSGDTLKYPSGASSDFIGADVRGGDGVGVALIEGLNVATVSGVTYTEPFPGATGAPNSGSIIPGVYGGLNRADSSGTMAFVSSRYGGFTLASNAEINGMTFGGVGSGTVCEWLEVFNNSDDSFEFFGGFANFRYLFSCFHDDDGFDGDQGFNGNMQFLFDIADNLSIARSGYAQNNTVTGRVTDTDNVDKNAEWDGSEGATQNGSVTPNTSSFIHNFTFIGSAQAGDDSVTLRRGITGGWLNGLLQDIVDDAFAVAADAGAVTENFNVYASVGDNATQLGANIYSDDAATALPVEVVGNGHVAKNGLDPRTRGGSASAVLTNFNKPADRGGTYPFTGWTPVSFGGAMRDNNMLKGWSTMEYLDALGTTNIARPAVSVGISGSNPTVNFAASGGVGGRVAIYSVERSTDRKVWTPFAVVSDNSLAGTVDRAGTTFAAPDANAATGAVTVTDTGTTLTAGVAVYYRVIPQ